MRIISSISFIALGAILAFAMHSDVTSIVDIDLVGRVPMSVVVLGLIAGLVLAATRHPVRVSEWWSVAGPGACEIVGRRGSRYTALHLSRHARMCPHHGQSG